MNNLKKVNTRNLLMTLMILAGITTASCEKVEIEKGQEHEGRVIVTEMNDDRGGGDDDEEPIVRGIVETNNGTPVVGATVEIFKAGDTSPTDSDTTDANGEFEVTVPAGDYFFKVTVSGSTTTTNTISVNGDMNVVIIV